MMQVLYALRDHLVDDIEELNKKDDISPTELDRVYKAIDIIKDIQTIEAMAADKHDKEPEMNTARRYSDPTVHN